MTHPFLFHPQAAPWFKESADTLQLTLFSELDAPIREVWLRHEPDNEEYLVAMTPVATRDRLQVWQVELPLARGGRSTSTASSASPTREQWWLHGAGVSAAMPPPGAAFPLQQPSPAPGLGAGSGVLPDLPRPLLQRRPVAERQASRVRVQGKAVISKAWGEPVSRHEEGHGACEFYGGDLAGIDAKLHYLQSLGVTALYLNPIFDSPSNHKYDTQDYFKVDAHLGTNAQFAELTRNLHQRGMRIILDAVVNHTSTEHPWFCPPLGAQSNPDPLAQLLHLRSGRDYVSWKGSAAAQAGFLQ